MEPFATEKLHCSAGGFTLLEVLASCAIFAIALTFILKITTNNLNSMNLDQTKAIATQVASNVMEDLLLRSSSDPAFNGGPTSEAFDQNGNVLVGSSLPFFTASWTINFATPIPNIMQIQLVISWQVSGLSQSISLVSYRSSQ